jgi:flagellar hook-basal body complex protein FliE
MSLPLGGITALGVGAPNSITSVTNAGIPPLKPGEGGDGFAKTLAAVFDQLQGAQNTSNQLATQAATGDLKDVHDYMIASSEAGLATEMVVTIKNKAVEAFNEIMRMPV